MNIRVFAILGICVFAFKTHGQNFVPNPSFEIKISCPNNLDQLLYAFPWRSPTANTPDYFNSCSASNVDVPSNFIGFQYAQSGQAFAGIGAGAPDTNDNRREYIQCKLIDTLITGKKYCVEFFVSLSDSSKTAIDRIGIYFSSTAIQDFSTIEYLAYQPQIESQTGVPIIDTDNWVKISGFIIATGNETYITIGNFHRTSETVADSLPGTWYGAYYYIDDVSVYEIAACNAGNNAIICADDSLQLGTFPDSTTTYLWQPSNGLNNNTIANPKASPFSTTTYTLTQTQCNVVSTSTVTVSVERDCNSASNIFIQSLYFENELIKVFGLESNSKIEIFDARGRIVFSAEDYENNFWTARLANGVYFARLTRPNQQVMNWKFCVVK